MTSLEIYLIIALLFTLMTFWSIQFNIGLFAKVKKCEWHKDLVEFLGYILKTEGLMMAEDKVNIICKWPKPQKVKDVQSFLSFANFYHHFIYNYSDITVPLTWLTCKGTPRVF